MVSGSDYWVGLAPRTPEPQCRRWTAEARNSVERAAVGGLLKLSLSRVLTSGRQSSAYGLGTFVQPARCLPRPHYFALGYKMLL